MSIQLSRLWEDNLYTSTATNSYDLDNNPRWPRHSAVSCVYINSQCCTYRYLQYILTYVHTHTCIYLSELIFHRAITRRQIATAIFAAWNNWPRQPPSSIYDIAFVPIFLSFFLSFFILSLPQDAQAVCTRGAQVRPPGRRCIKRRVVTLRGIGARGMRDVCIKCFMYRPGWRRKKKKEWERERARDGGRQFYFDMPVGSSGARVSYAQLSSLKLTISGSFGEYVSCVSYNNNGPRI